MYTVRDVATKLKVNPETLRRWIRSSELEAIHYGVGRKNGSRITQEQLRIFLSNHPKHIPHDEIANSQNKESLWKEIEHLDATISKLMDERRILINELKSLG